MEEIDKNARLPLDLRSIFKNGVLITFSFSTLDEKMARIFEPELPPQETGLGPSIRLKMRALRPE